VLGPMIHAWTLDQEDACIIILCDWSWERLYPIISMILRRYTQSSAHCDTL
jgi:hypothetical protein